MSDPSPNARNRFRDVVFKATQQLEDVDLMLLILSIRKELDRQLDLDLRKFTRTKTAGRLLDKDDTTEELACDLCGDLFYRRDPEEDDDDDDEDQNRAKNTLAPYPDRQHEQVVAACSACRERLAKLGRRDAVPPEEPKPTNPILSSSSPSEPAAESIEKAFDRLIAGELGEFAANLDMARSIYRQYPKLVRARKFPEHLRKAFIEANECEPDTCEVGGSLVITDEKRAELLAEAREIARGWMLKEQGYTDSDLEALKSMGISA